MTLTHTEIDGVIYYVAISTFQEKDIPKAAKFRWNTPIEGKWSTNEAHKANLLRDYAETDTLKILDSAIKERQDAIDGSKAADADISIPCPDGLAYLPFQKAGIAYAMKREATLIGDAPGLGKGHPMGTKILTPTGWKEIQQLETGDLVIGKSGKSTKVCGVYPRGMLPVYKVTFNDNTSVEVDPEHLWAVRTGSQQQRGSAFSTKETQELASCVVDISGKRTWRIPLVCPIEFDRHDALPVDPYILGVLLGDGSLSHHPTTFTPGDEKVPVEVKRALPGNLLLRRCDHKDRATTYIITSGKDSRPNHYLSSLREMGLQSLRPQERFVPEAYLFSSVVNRISLLNGLMDTDGWISSKDGHVEFNSSSLRLAEAVAFIVQSLGGVTRLHDKETHYVYDGEKKSGLRCYMVTINLPPEINPFRAHADRYKPKTKYFPNRIIKSIDFVGHKEVVCISVEAKDHLYVTEHCIVTHNTIQAAGVINIDESIKTVLVVCPVSPKINWQRELDKWLVRPMSICIVDSKNGADPLADIWIINYDILNKFSKEIKARQWDLLVCDEAHYLKNPKAQRTIEVLGKWDKDPEKIVPKIEAKRRLFLTGTPIVNKPIEMWPLIKSLDPDGLGKSWKYYVVHYCDGGQTQYGWDVSGASNLGELQDNLRASIMVRRLKEDVLTELPPKFRQVVELSSDGYESVVKKERGVIKDQQDRIAAAKAAVMVSKAGDDKEEYRRAVEALQEANSAAFEEIARIRHDTAVAKIPAVIDHLKECLESGQKIVVFAHHHDVVDAIRENIGCESVCVTGKTPLKKRQEAVDRFQNDPECMVFVGNIQAAGVAITLTAASHVVFAELDWVPGNMSQAEDRCHRHGQKDNVLVQHLVLEDSLDSHMAKVLVSKQDVIDKALDKATEEDNKSILADILYVASSLVLDKKDEETITFSSGQVEAIHLALQTLSCVCDGAVAIDGAGFNKFDSEVGKSLASRHTLTTKQAALGRKLVNKYRRQVSDDILSVIFGQEVAV